MEPCNISFSDELAPDNPASVNRKTGQIKLNRSLWFRIPDIYKRLIVSHEKGHYLKQTRSEIEADEYAFSQIAGTEPGSLKKIVIALDDLLKTKTPVNENRVKRMLKRALIFDYEKNGNINAFNELKKLNSSYMMSGYENTSNFLGLGNKKKKEEKERLKAEYGSEWRAEWKDEKEAAGGGKALRQQFRTATKEEKAGVASATSFDIVDMANRLGGGMAGRLAGPSTNGDAAATESTEPGKKILGMSMTMFIIVIVGLIILVAGGYFLLKKKK